MKYFVDQYIKIMAKYGLLLLYISAFILNGFENRSDLDDDLFFRFIFLQYEFYLCLLLSSVRVTIYKTKEEIEQAFELLLISSSLVLFFFMVGVSFTHTILLFSISAMLCFNSLVILIILLTSKHKGVYRL